MYAYVFAAAVNACTDQREVDPAHAGLITGFASGQRGSRLSRRAVGTMRFATRTGV
jgi:hypothetical protein